MVYWNQGLFSTVLTGWFIETRIYLVQYWQCGSLEPGSI